MRRCAHRRYDEAARTAGALANAAGSASSAGGGGDKGGSGGDKGSGSAAGGSGAALGAPGSVGEPTPGRDSVADEAASTPNFFASTKCAAARQRGSAQRACAVRVPAALTTLASRG